MKDKSIRFEIILILVVSLVTIASLNAGEVKERRLVDKTAAASMHYSFTGVGNELLPANSINSIGSPGNSMGSVKSTNGIGISIGTTWYEYQRNGSMGRMIAHSDNLIGSDPPVVHFSWMKLYSESGSERKYAYNTYFLTSGTYIGQIGIQPNGEWAGYVGIDLTNDQRAIVGGHNSQAIDNLSDAHFYWDFGPGYAFFGNNYEVPRSLSEYTGGAPDIGQEVDWPKFKYVETATDTVLHVIAASYETGSNTDPKGLYYFARRGSDNDPSATWDNPPKIIDTVYTNGHDLVANSIGWVTLCWIANIPCDGDGDTESGYQCRTYPHEEQDIYYMRSLDQGQSFQPRVNVTNNRYNIDIVDAYLPQSDLSCITDGSGWLHIVWNGRYWPASGQIPNNRRSRLLHYYEASGGITTAHATDWEPVNCNGGNWAMNTAKMSISRCNDNFYIIFTQFNDNDCASASNPGYPTGASNGDLYMVVSDDLGATWDDARNLTNTQSPGCDQVGGAGGPCASENWASVTPHGTQLATSADNVVIPEGGSDNGWYLDVQYIDDPSAGAAIFGEGYSQEADVRWFRLACVDPYLAPSTPDNWSTLNHDYARTGKSNISLDDIECDLTLNWKFEHPSDGVSFTGPVVYGDYVVCSFGDEYRVFDLNGNPQYTISGLPLGGSVRCAPTITTIAGYPNPVMFISGGNQHSIMAYDFNTGSLIWSRDITTVGSGGLFGQTRWGNFIVLNLGGTDYVFWGTDDGFVVGANALTGVLKTGFPVALNQSTWISGATDGFSLFYATQAAGVEGDVYSINPNTGTINWQLSANGGLQAVNEYTHTNGYFGDEGFTSGVSYDDDPLLGGVLYANSRAMADYPTDGIFYRIDASSGFLKGPVTQANRGFYSAPMIGENHVYVPSLSRWSNPPAGGHILAVNKITGNFDWVTSSYSEGRYYMGGVLSSETSGPNKIMIFDEDGFLSCFSADDGSELFRRRTFNVPGSSPNIGMNGAIVYDELSGLHVLFADFWGNLFDLTKQSNRPRLEITKYNPIVNVNSDPDINGVVTVNNVFTNTGCDILTFTTVTADEITTNINIPEEPPSAKAGTISKNDDNVEKINISIRNVKSGSYELAGVPSYLENINLPTASSTISPGDSLDLILDLDLSLLPDEDTIVFYITLCTTDPDFFLSNTSLCPEIKVILLNTSCCQVRGDALHDNGLVLVNDLVYLVNYVFKGGPPPECLEEGDVILPLDGLILVNDLVLLVNYVFKGGPPPPPC